MIDLNDAGPQPGATEAMKKRLEAEEAEDRDRNRNRNRNPITGSQRPEDFQINNDKPLHDALHRIRGEIQWLASEGYEYVQEDLNEAVWVMTEIAACMRCTLGEVLERVDDAFRLAVQRDCRFYWSWIPEVTVHRREVKAAIWNASRAGVTEEDLVEQVRDIVHLEVSRRGQMTQEDLVNQSLGVPVIER